MCHEPLGVLVLCLFVVCWVGFGFYSRGFLFLLWRIDRYVL